MILALLYAIMAGCEESTRPKSFNTTAFSLPCWDFPGSPINPRSGDSSNGFPPKPFANLSRYTINFELSCFPCPSPGRPSDLRSGLRRAHSLWKAPICQSGLQSQEAWTPILPSPAVLRSPFAGVLAWVSTPRRCCHPYRRRSVSQNLPGQGACQDGSLPHPVSGRLGVFRQESDRVPRFRWLRLCDCGQGIPDDQNPSPRVSFPEAPEWLGGRQVCLQARFLEKTASVCRGPASDPPRSDRSPAIDSFQRSHICLSRFGYESEDPSLARPAILCPTGYGRKEHPRTSLRLSSWENSYRRIGWPMWPFFRFCYLPSTWSIGSKGFASQASISTRRWSTIRTDFLPLPAKLTRKGSKNVLSLPHDYHYRDQFEYCFSQNRQASFFVNLQLTFTIRLCVYKGFCTKNTIFIRIFEVQAISFPLFPVTTPPQSPAY